MNWDLRGIEVMPRQLSDQIGFQSLVTLPRAAVGIGYIAGYVLLDWLSFLHPSMSFGITPWNPATGLSFVMILLFGPWTIPYLLVAPLVSDVVNLPTPLPWTVELLVAAIIGGVYSAALIFLLRPIVRFDPLMRSLRDLALLMIVAVISAALVASGYVGVMIAAGLLPVEDAGAATFRYWVGDMIGIMVVTPFALVVLTRPRIFRASVETILQIAAIIAALALVFGLAQERQFQLFYILFLPIVWMAVRAGFEGVSLGILITQLGLIIGVELFRDESRDLMAFQVLMLILAVTGLVAGELVTERRRTEFELRLHRESLAKRARLGNLGELAAAIAHEINQPLAAAGTYTRVIRDTLQEGGSDPIMLAETAKKAAAQVDRAAEVMRRLRSLVRLDRSGRAPCSVEKIVRETIALCQPSLDRSYVLVSWSGASSLPLVIVDMLQIEQVLLNLVRNSIEAISESKLGNGVISIQAFLDTPASVEIRVADNGPGFPADLLESFPPFTSQKTEGLGIGLSLCRSIIEAHGGRLWLNRDTEGAEVRFTLPIAQAI